MTQLYNAGEDITQCISCQVVCFDTYKFAGNRTPSTVLCVASRDVQNHGKVRFARITWCRGLISCSTHLSMKASGRGVCRTLVKSA